MLERLVNSPWLLNFIPLLVLVVYVVLYYLGLPLLIRARQWMPANPQFKERDPDDLDPDVRRFLMSGAQDLFALGFGEPTLVEIPDGARNVTSCIIMLVNRQAGDAAAVSVIRARGLASVETAYVEFSTRFDTGDVFNTLNSSTLGAFAAVPRTVKTQVPMLRDPRELYALHTFVMGRHALEGAKVLYEPGWAVDHLARCFVRSYDEQVRQGRMVFDEENLGYRFSVKGTYLMTWGLMPPFKTIRRRNMTRKARRILDEFRRARAHDRRLESRTGARPET